MHTRLTMALALTALATLTFACSSDGSTHAGDKTGSKPKAVVQQEEGPFDPLGGQYPQIMWMVNVFEADGPLEFGADGTIAHRRGEGPRAMVFAPAAVDPAFKAVRALPGYYNVAAPALFTKPGAHGVLEPESRDKAHQSIGPRKIDVVASFRNQETLAVDAIARDEAKDGSNQVRTNTMDVPVGGALAVILPSPDSDTWSVIMLRPTVLRSRDDFPFQTSTMLPTAQPNDPLKGDYPQIFWHASVYESSRSLEVTDDGRIIETKKFKPNGLAVIDAAGAPKLFESISALECLKEVAEPSLLTKVGDKGRIEIGAKDKAGRALQSRSLEVKGSRVENAANEIGVEANVEIMAGSTYVGTGSGERPVPSNGVLVLLCARPNADVPETLLVLRPRLMLSAKDYPFQTSDPLPLPPMPSRPQSVK